MAEELAAEATEGACLFVRSVHLLHSPILSTNCREAATAAQM